MNTIYIQILSNNLWTTKGSRFTAHSRLMAKHRISNITVGILSCYLIILGLLSVYNLIDTKQIDSNLLAFGSTSISVLVLFFSQIESANDYKIRALQHHACSLKIDKLYRTIKNFKSNPTEEEVLIFCKKMNGKYHKILKNFDNHKTIDYNKFKSSYRSDFKVSKSNAIVYKIIYYIDIYWLYSLLIITPLIGFFWILFLVKK